VSETITINGIDENGQRINSKRFEELVQEAAKHSSHLVLNTFGQHNVGGRLAADDREFLVEVHGPCGQRLGCMGRPGTRIVCHGSASDDVGYLNIGAEIVVLGDATNGVCNAMAEGRVMIGGSIGARGLTMTKWNPAYARPELWVLGSVGDAFAEFNCGGVAVVCGVEPKTPDNILGYRPCVGMVGGWIFYRGKTDGSYAVTNVREMEPDDEQWGWLMERMPHYLESIGKPELFPVLSVRSEWKVLMARTPQEITKMFGKTKMSMAEFRDNVWNKGFGGGDPLRDIDPELDRSPIGLIVTGDLRRRKPVWDNSGQQKCRDCHMCEMICPEKAISREKTGEGKKDFEYLSDDEKCIACGFCADICPCNIWNMKPF
jgi:glutamate synthase domain-containing protein 3/Pyruvate/2-oxoacid:ferredoxin oxidoreductase delta subunit